MEVHVLVQCSTIFLILTSCEELRFPFQISGLKGDTCANGRLVRACPPSTNLADNSLKHVKCTVPWSSFWQWSKHYPSYNDL